MGKKVRQASLEVSKNERQLQSLIKVLRPKVYITDSSSFKSLVQELTGNGSSITSPPTIEPDVQLANVPVIDIKDQEDPESSIEASFASLEYSSELCHQVSLNEELNQVSNPIYLDDSTFEDSAVNYDSTFQDSAVNYDSTFQDSAVNYDSTFQDSTVNYDSTFQDSTVNYGVDLLAYNDHDSWPLDMESSPFYNDHAQIDQEVSIYDYDYEFSGLL
ncbi:hypothetical protein CMV_022425 [Castanea mollissima]|uniref:VQ domain-containing protein n=1 Tax=Castanea mollissima TaxID=60419 RepID=A0A8J4QRL9_9ROSI|nr:hypothetical protein CMV_022425 [Castanea mollissima]